MDTIFVLIAAALLVAFIVWWFFGKRPASEAEATLEDEAQQATITVNGGYSPAVVVLRQGVPAELVFHRKDPSGCFDEVVFPDFGIREHLPVNEAFSVDIDTNTPGEYHYSCGMNMFHGKVVVK